MSSMAVSSVTASFHTVCSSYCAEWLGRDVGESGPGAGGGAALARDGGRQSSFTTSAGSWKCGSGAWEQFAEIQIWGPATFKCLWKSRRI